eukprot:jgi/Mesvir1/18486/Mv14331-RA.1
MGISARDMARANELMTLANHILMGKGRLAPGDERRATTFTVKKFVDAFFRRSKRDGKYYDDLYLCVQWLSGEVTEEFVLNVDDNCEPALFKMFDDGWTSTLAPAQWGYNRATRKTVKNAWWGFRLYKDRCTVFASCFMPERERPRFDDVFQDDIPFLLVNAGEWPSTMYSATRPQEAPDSPRAFDNAQHRRLPAPPPAASGSNAGPSSRSVPTSPAVPAAKLKLKAPMAPPPVTVTLSTSSSSEEEAISTSSSDDSEYAPLPKKRFAGKGVRREEEEEEEEKTEPVTPLPPPSSVKSQEVVVETPPSSPLLPSPAPPKSKKRAPKPPPSPKWQLNMEEDEDDDDFSLPIV